MIKMLVCDDDKKFLLTIKNHINKIILSGQFSDFEYEFSYFNDPKSALSFCSKQSTDISFLDIDMPDLSGFDIAEMIHNKNNNAIVIFVTNCENYLKTILI